MAKISYRRLASAMIELLETHELPDVAAAAAGIMTSGGGRPNLERLLPELERELARQHNHIVVHATTARPLPHEVLERLAAELAKQVNGTSHELNVSVDPKLLAGARLTTADASLDLSLAAQLQNLRTSRG